MDGDVKKDAFIAVHRCPSPADPFLSPMAEAANPKGDALGLKRGRTEPGQEPLRPLLALNLEQAGMAAQPSKSVENR